MKQKHISQELVEFLTPMVEADMWNPLRPEETRIIGEAETAAFLDKYCLYRGDEAGFVDWLEYMLVEEYDRRTGMYECQVREMDDFIRHAIAGTVFSPSFTMFRLDTMSATGVDILSAGYRFYYVIETEEWLVMDFSEAEFDEEATGINEGNVYEPLKKACERGRKSVTETNEQ